MIEGLTLGNISDVGVVALVLLFGLALATNRLYTRGQVREIEAAHAREIKRMEDAHTRELADAAHERTEWRTEARLNQQTVVELQEQNRAMLTAFGPTLTDFLEKLRQLATRIRDERSTGA